MADIEFKINRRRAGGSITVSEILSVHPEVNEVARDADRVVMVYDMRGPTNAIVGTTSEFIILMNDTEDTVHIRVLTDPGGHVVHDGEALLDGLLDIAPNELIRIDKAANGVNPVFATSLGNSEGSVDPRPAYPTVSAGENIVFLETSMNTQVSYSFETRYMFRCERHVDLGTAEEWINHTMFYPSHPEYEPAKAYTFRLFIPSSVLRGIAAKAGVDINKLVIKVLSTNVYATWFGSDFNGFVNLDLPLVNGSNVYFTGHIKLLYCPSNPANPPVFGRKVTALFDVSIGFAIPKGPETGIPGITKSLGSSGEETVTDE